MTEQEKINEELQTKLALQDAKFNMFMQEMSDRDNQRAEDMREIRSAIQSTRTLNIATIIGVAAIVVAVLLR